MLGNSKTLLNFRKDSIYENLYITAIFFLVSAPFISSLILIFILALNLNISIKSFKQNRVNFLLIIILILMILSCIDKSINQRIILEGIDPFLTWISLINWIPLFLLFLGSQKFLNSKSKRERIMKVICFGTVPLIVSGIGQYFFNWNGPFKFLNGLIIWYQRPILGEVGILANGISGLTGLFNNANTAADWLLVVIPMQIYFLIKKNSSYIEKIFFFTLTSLSVLSLILTNSRSSILGFAGVVTFLLNSKLILLVLTFSFLTIFISYIFNISFVNNLINLLKIEYLKSLFLGLISDPRFDIWRNALNFIFARPIFGYGAASIGILYSLKNLGTVFHVHNIFGELAIIYGIPTAVLTTFFISNIFIKLVKVFPIKDFFKKKLKDLDNTWILSTILIVYTQIIDFTYYDYRISLIFWILLSGLNSIKDKEKVIIE